MAFRFGRCRAQDGAPHDEVGVEPDDRDRRGHPCASDLQPPEVGPEGDEDPRSHETGVGGLAAQVRGIEIHCRPEGEVERRIRSRG